MVVLTSARSRMARNGQILGIEDGYFKEDGAAWEIVKGRLDVAGHDDDFNPRPTTANGRGEL